jgi:hypothetical protein
MKETDYGTKEELIRVANTIRKTMFDFYMGRVDKQKFLRVYWEFEGFLLEHEYAEEDDYFECDLPDTEKFLEKQYNLEKQLILINYGNIIGGKSDEEIEEFIIRREKNERTDNKKKRNNLPNR